ncbi:hypothetical protein CSAL01_03678 [Colletotrichum salicis]|uniref:Uncharacterized protein n=1 Tax=Colletotrichum salicis TaxID=1209931 RepID=A0A135V2Q8_9PEZI|nr:hypothetical protein CSAL01_03678 [Colletotrichum salicis]
MEAIDNHRQHVVDKDEGEEQVPSGEGQEEQQQQQQQEQQQQQQQGEGEEGELAPGSNSQKSVTTDPKLALSEFFALPCPTFQPTVVNSRRSTIRTWKQNHAFHTDTLLKNSSVHMPKDASRIQAPRPRRKASYCSHVLRLALLRRGGSATRLLAFAHLTPPHPPPPAT